MCAAAWQHEMFRTCFDKHQAMNYCMRVSQWVSAWVCVHEKNRKTDEQENGKLCGNNSNPDIHTHRAREKAVRKIYQQQCSTVAQKFECWHEGYAQVNKWFFDGFKHISTRILLLVQAICVCFILISWCTVVKMFSFWVGMHLCVCVCASRLHYDTATQLIH